MLAARTLIVIGAGRVGRSLIDVLPEDCTVCLIDLDPARLERIRDPGVRLIAGDATSRLVLEEAGVGPRAVVAIVTGSDRVNREVARILRQDFNVEELVVLLDDLKDLDSLGVFQREVVERTRSNAMLVYNRLSGTETRGVGLGLGQGELRQVTVIEGSAAAGRPLAEMKPRRWLVAAVFRDQKLIVPHGETVLEPGDDVLIVGPPEVTREVGAFIRGGSPVFPSQYGTRIGVLGDAAVAEEATWLSEHTHALGVSTIELSRVHPKHNSPGEIAQEIVDQSVGCLVVEPMPITLSARIGFTRSTRKQFILAARIPILVARGSAPYKRILLAVGANQSADAIATLAIDIARQFDASLTVLSVLAPSLAQGTEEQAPAKELPKRMAHLARLHGLTVERRLDEGNPIERIRAHAKEFDLLVVGHSPRARNSIFSPDISLFLLHDAPCSVLFAPWNPAAG